MLRHTNRAGALVQVEGWKALAAEDRSLDPATGDRGNAVRWRVLQLSKVWIHFQSSQPEFLTDTEDGTLESGLRAEVLLLFAGSHSSCARPSAGVATQKIRHRYMSKFHGSIRPF